MPTTIRSRAPATRAEASFDTGAAAVVLLLSLLFAGALSAGTRPPAPMDRDAAASAALQGGL